MTIQLDPTTSLDYSSSAEQNVQLQPSSYQPVTTTPTPPTPPTPPASSTSSAGSTSSSTSGSGPTDSVQISYNAQIKQLSSQGMSAADIAQTMGATVASVDTLLDITPTTTTSTSSTSTTTAPTILL